MFYVGCIFLYILSISQMNTAQPQRSKILQTNICDGTLFVSFFLYVILSFFLSFIFLSISFFLSVPIYPLHFSLHSFLAVSCLSFTPYYVSFFATFCYPFSPLSFAHRLSLAPRLLHILVRLLYSAEISTYAVIFFSILSYLLSPNFFFSS